MRPWWSLDVETSGTLPEYALQPHRFRQGKAWITTIAMSRKTADGRMKSTGTVYPMPAEIGAVLDHAIEKQARIVCWNGTFDIAWLLAYGLERQVFKLKWIDAMRLKRHVHVVPTFQSAGTDKLKEAIAERWPELAGYEDDVDYHNQDAAYLRDVVLPYNIIDTERTLELGLEYFDALTPQQRDCAITEAYCLPMVAQANLDGMRIDHDAVAVLDTTLSEKADRLEQELVTHGVTEKIVRSPKQLGNLLFKQWGLIPIKHGKPNKKTGEVLPSTDKETLEELSPLDDRVALLGDWRQTLNAKGKFVAGVRESVIYNGDGMSRPQAIIFGTYSSRFTYSSKQGKGVKERPMGFALHQMLTRMGGKTDKRFRSLILAPEGYDIVEFDAIGQEFRWMAVHSRDETMLSLCEDGEGRARFHVCADLQPGLRRDQGAREDRRQGRQGRPSAGQDQQLRLPVSRRREEVPGHGPGPIRDTPVS